MKLNKIIKIINLDLEENESLGDKVEGLSHYYLRHLKSKLVEQAENGIVLSDEFLDFYNLISKGLLKKEKEIPIGELSISERFLKQFVE